MPSFSRILGSAQLENLVHHQAADIAVRRALNEAIRSSGKSRETIVEQMSKLLGREVTTFMLNGFTAGSKKASRFPAIWVPAFCEVVKDDRLARLLLPLHLRHLLELGARVADAEEIWLQVEALRVKLSRRFEGRKTA